MMRLRCANNISTFFRSLRDWAYASVLASPHFSPGVCRQPVEQLVVATAGLDVLHRVLWARDHAHQLVQATFWFIFALAAINIL